MKNLLSTSTLLILLPLLPGFQPAAPVPRNLIFRSSGPAGTFSQVTGVKPVADTGCVATEWLNNFSAYEAKKVATPILRNNLLFIYMKLSSIYCKGNIFREYIFSIEKKKNSICLACLTTKLGTEILFIFPSLYLLLEKSLSLSAIIK